MRHLFPRDDASKDMFLFRTASGWILAGLALLMVPVGFLHALYIADEETLLQVSA